ncbi:DUF6884 domain-containing protein [Undibacterium sp. WLX3042]|uniref:DUF6884 domain-containing protein n=1 Tax=Undibacterium sp. WLX3042 TaxID=3412686 RepID=UPI003C2FAFB0
MKNKIILISCVSQKLEQSEKVQNLYISTLFRYNLKYARSLKPNGIYVLSAKHGLLNLDQEIEPYEQTLNTMRFSEIKEWARLVLQQLSEIASLDEDEFIFLAGNKYRKYLLPHIKHSHIPLEGLSIGKQLQKLKELTK